MQHQIQEQPIVRPRSELKMAVLNVEGEVVDVYGASAHVEGGGQPVHVSS